MFPTAKFYIDISVMLGRAVGACADFARIQHHLAECV